MWPGDAGARVDIDFDELAAMVELLKDTDFSEFVYEKGDLRIVLTRGDSAGHQHTPQALSREATSPAHAGFPQQPSSGTSSRKQQAERPDDVVTGGPAAADEVDGVQVTAPMLGTFYRQPKPGEPPFVQIGDVVTPDTVVCIIEVMKLMNSVKAGQHGRVVQFLVGDGDLVEQDQPLLVLEPDEA